MEIPPGATIEATLISERPRTVQVTVRKAWKVDDLTTGLYVADDDGRPIAVLTDTIRILSTPPAATEPTTTAQPADPPDTYDWVTNQMFGAKLIEIVNRSPASALLLQVPDVYASVAEHYNNQVLDELQRDRKVAGA